MGPLTIHSQDPMRLMYRHGKMACHLINAGVRHKLIREGLAVYTDHTSAIQLTDLGKAWVRSRRMDLYGGRYDIYHVSCALGATLVAARKEKHVTSIIRTEYGNAAGELDIRKASSQDIIRVIGMSGMIHSADSV